MNRLKWIYRRGPEAVKHLVHSQTSYASSHIKFSQTCRAHCWCCLCEGFNMTALILYPRGIFSAPWCGCSSFIHQRIGFADILRLFCLHCHTKKISASHAFITIALWCLYQCLYIHQLVQECKQWTLSVDLQVMESVTVCWLFDKIHMIWIVYAPSPQSVVERRRSDVRSFWELWKLNRSLSSLVCFQNRPY